MASKKLTQLDEATSVDYLYGELSNVSKKITSENVLASRGIITSVGDVGFGIADAGDLLESRITILPSGSGFGPELLTNGSFAGNANGWTLGDGWAYTGGKVTYTPNSGFGFISQPLTPVTGSSYRVTGTISGRTAGVLYVTVGNRTDNVSSVNGDFSIDLIPTTVGGEIVRIGVSDDAFDGSVTNLSCKEALVPSLFMGMHEDGFLAVRYTVSSSGGGETSEVKINSDDSFTIMPGNYFGIRQNPIDGGNTAYLDHYAITQDRTLAFPDADGTFALKTSASDTFTTVDGKTVTVVNGIITSITSA